MISTERVPWLRIGAESIAIVASILLAFALNAWWDQRSSARSERGLLQALLRELTIARDQLNGQLSTYDSLIVVTETVANRLVTAGEEQSVTMATADLGALLLNMSYDPPMGTANLILDSDQSAVIQDIEIRAAVAEWPAIVQDAVEEQVALWSIGDSQLEPLLHDAVTNMAQLYNVRATWEKLRTVESPKADGETTVVSSHVLWNALYQRLTYLRGARNELESADEHLVHMIELVEVSLGAATQKK